MPRVILVGTHADVVRAPRLSNGDFNSPQAIALTKKLRMAFSTYFDIHPTPIVVDAHVPNSYGIKFLKTTISDIKNAMWQVCILIIQLYVFVLEVIKNLFYLYIFFYLSEFLKISSLNKQKEV